MNKFKVGDVVIIDKKIGDFCNFNNDIGKVLIVDQAGYSIQTKSNNKITTVHGIKPEFLTLLESMREE